MLVNLTNHKLSTWPKEQVKEAINTFGEVVDLIPPKIEPLFSIQEVLALARHFTAMAIKLLAKSREAESGVLVSGEFTFIWCCINLLQLKGVDCYAATTPNNKIVESPNTITSTYQFSRFRKYLTTEEMNG